MARSVAVEGEVLATPSSGFQLTSPITLQTDPKLTVGGKPVVVGAIAIFADTNGNLETVTLVGAGKLRQASGGVLLDGDSKTGPLGNKLQVSATGKLCVG